MVAANAGNAALSPTSSGSMTAEPPAAAISDDDGIRVGAATQVGSDDLSAAAGEVQRDAAAEAATGAGDERDSSGHAASVRPSSVSRRARCCGTLA